MPLRSSTSVCLRGRWASPAAGRRTCKSPPCEGRSRLLMAIASDGSKPRHGRRDRPEAQQLGSPPPPPPPAAVRPYLHACDHTRLAHICRNVYGGTDDLPQRVAHLHSEPGKLGLRQGIATGILFGRGAPLAGVLPLPGFACCLATLLWPPLIEPAKRTNLYAGNHLLAACTGGEGGQLDALLCCQERGDVLWLFGARTAEELRGNGLAGMLLVRCGWRERVLLSLQLGRITFLAGGPLCGELVLVQHTSSRAGGACLACPCTYAQSSWPSLPPGRGGSSCTHAAGHSRPAVHHSACQPHHAAPL